MARPNGVARTSDTDNYPTPAWGTLSLLDQEDFSGTVLEPACCQGAMVLALRDRGLDVCASDIRMGQPLSGVGGIDFLGSHYMDKSFDHVITNPPFRRAEEFVRKALRVARKKVAFLLRLQFVESATRYQMFQSTPFKGLIQFSSRLTMWPEGTPSPEYAQRGGTTAYAWFVWDHEKPPGALPTIRWVPPRDLSSEDRVVSSGLAVLDEVDQMIPGQMRLLDV